MNNQLLKIAQREIARHNEISADIRAAILLQQVTFGMSPFEAKMAAGAFAFKVKLDGNKWPPNTDPLLVIDAQHAHPDESEIWLTFENDTQFTGEGLKRFDVYFTHGRVNKIEAA